jgi:hypothetical protein
MNQGHWGDLYLSSPGNFSCLTGTSLPSGPSLPDASPPPSLPYLLPPPPAPPPTAPLYQQKFLALHLQPPNLHPDTLADPMLLLCCRC